MGPLRSGERAQQRGFGELPLPGRRRLDIYVGDVVVGHCVKFSVVQR